MNSALVVGLAVLALGSPRRRPVGRTAPGRDPRLRAEHLNLLTAGKLTLGTDNPAFPPWWGGAPKKPWKVSQPVQRQGLRVGGRIRGREAARLRAERGRLDGRCRSTTRTRPARSRSTSTSRRSRTSLSGRRPSTSRTRTTRSTRRSSGASGKPIAKVKSVAGAEAVQVRRARSGRRATTTSSTYIKPSQKPKVYDTVNDAVTGAQERPDRRPRRRLAEHRLHHGRPAAEQRGRRQAADAVARQEHFGLVFAEGKPRSSRA